MIKSTELLQTSREVWNFMKQQGGMNEDYYDDGVIIDLRTKLFLPLTGSMEQLLDDNSISVEDFIIAFFQVVQPYIEMMSDLLRLFERAKARKNNHNLAVEFDFGKKIPPLKFDLNYFRDQLQTWKKQTNNVIESKWDRTKLWALLHAFGDINWDAKVNDFEFRTWFQKYESNIWPSQRLPYPRTTDIILDSELFRAWEVWESFIRASRQYGSNRLAAHNRWRELREVEEIVVEFQPWALDILNTEHDQWAGSFARCAYYWTESILTLPLDEKQARVAQLRYRLAEIFDQVPKQHVRDEQLVQQLVEFLNLPFWKRRSELYSAWISTQILAAIPNNESIRIHTVEDKLIFAFSGTHLATVDAFEPRLHIWAELRSSLADPTGKGRKKAIQPDYSLITDPLGNPQASILEVECKQYRKPSARNFSDALTDYAKGRPNAQVLLVNYGPINDTHLERVNKKVRSRTHQIGNMRPGSKVAQESFKQLIQKTIQNRFDKDSSTKYLDYRP